MDYFFWGGEGQSSSFILAHEQKADLDGEFLTAIAEQPNEILKCAMYLFLGYLDGATQFAQS